MVVVRVVILFPVILLISLSAFAAEKLTLTEASGKQIHLVKYQDVVVSDFCIKKTNTKCEALEMTKVKYKQEFPSTKSHGASMANPASVYCELLKGKSLSLKDAKGNEYAYCQFKDSSLIDAWSLYRQHFASDSK